MARPPIKNVTPHQTAPSPWLRRNLPWALAVLGVVGLCLIFPRLLAFAELAARQLRYFWWLVFMTAVGVYFFFFFGKKRD